MGLVALVGARSRLVVRSGALHVEKGGVVLRSLQTHEVTEVQVYGAADLSASARNLLLREGIDVLFLTADGRYRGRLVGAESRAGERRVAQYRLVTDVTRRLAVASAMVAGKIANQRALLLRRQESLRDEALADVLVALRASRRRAEEVGDLDTLRGVEGMAARRYFEGFGLALRNAAFSFPGRTRYPPRDPVNAALSYGYALLLSAVETAVRVAGLDLHVGVLHESGRGAPSLALDLMEELRPAVDGMVLNLLNLRQLGPEDFRAPSPEELGERAELSEGAVYLGDVGRSVVLRAWERALAEPTAHASRPERWPLRELLREQAQQLARVCEGATERYQPLVLRG